MNQPPQGTGTRINCVASPAFPPVTIAMIDPHFQCSHVAVSTRRIAVHNISGVIHGLSGEIQVCDDCGEFVGGAVVRIER